ncbi:threonine--tRNA ligase [Pycnococcus provasolii]
MASFPVGSSLEHAGAGAHGGAPGGAHGGLGLPPSSTSLFLVTHTIEAVTAKVPFAMMMLSQAFHSNQVPYQLRLRQIIPTSSLVSTSLWEAPSAADIITYLNGPTEQGQLNLSEFCKSEAFPVVPEYLHGVSLDLGKSQVVESVQTSANKAAASISATTSAATDAAKAKLAELDAKYKLTNSAKEATSKIKETTNKALEGANKAATNAFAEGTLLGQGWGFMKSMGERVTAAVRDYNEDGSEKTTEATEEEAAAAAPPPPPTETPAQSDTPAASVEAAPAAATTTTAHEEAPASSQEQETGQKKKKDKKKKKEGGGGGGGGPPSAEEIAAMKAAKQAEIEKKLIKDVTKEGGKKGVEIEGAADMGGLEFFCTTMEKPDGEVKYLKMSMDAMNEVPDPDGEERRGGSGHVGKMIFSAGTEAMSMVAYVPKDKQDRINATEWLKSVCADDGVKGELQAGGDAGLATAIAKADPDAGMFTIKMKDAAMAQGFAYLRERGCFPEDTGDDDDDDGDYMYGDDDFPS